MTAGGLYVPVPILDDNGLLFVLLMITSLWSNGELDASISDYPSF